MVYIVQSILIKRKKVYFGSTDCKPIRWVPQIESTKIEVLCLNIIGLLKTRKVDLFKLNGLLWTVPTLILVFLMLFVLKNSRCLCLKTEANSWKNVVNFLLSADILVYKYGTLLEVTMYFSYIFLLHWTIKYCAIFCSVLPVN